MKGLTSWKDESSWKPSGTMTNNASTGAIVRSFLFAPVVTEGLWLIAPRVGWSCISGFQRCVHYGDTRIARDVINSNTGRRSRGKIRDDSLLAAEENLLARSSCSLDLQGARSVAVDRNANHDDINNQPNALLLHGQFRRILRWLDN